MDKRTRKITQSAIFAALTLAFLYFAAVFPTGQLGIIAVASLFTVAVLIEGGLASAFSVYICSGILGALLLPNKGVTLLYLLFFGYYPIVKSLAERSGKRIAEWAVKLGVFLLALSVIWLLLKSIIFSSSVLNINTTVVYIAGCIIFVLYDIGLSRLISFYIARISKKFRK